MVNSRQPIDKLKELLHNSLGIQVNNAIRVFLHGSRFKDLMNANQKKNLFYGKVNITHMLSEAPYLIFRLRGELVYVVNTSSPDFPQELWQKELLFDELVVAQSPDEIGTNYTTQDYEFAENSNIYTLTVFGPQDYDVMLGQNTEENGTYLQSPHGTDADGESFEIAGLARYLYSAETAGNIVIKTAPVTLVIGNTYYDVYDWIGQGGEIEVEALSDNPRHGVEYNLTGFSAIEKRVVYNGTPLVLTGDHCLVQGRTYTWQVNQTNGTLVVALMAGASLLDTFEVPVVNGQVSFNYDSISAEDFATLTSVDVEYQAVPATIVKRVTNSTAQSVVIKINGVNESINAGQFKDLTFTEPTQIQLLGGQVGVNGYIIWQRRNSSNTVLGATNMTVGYSFAQSGIADFHNVNLVSA